ncbi:MAG: hypothetical protein JWO09_3307 [Bacteroidetes bacterium]|nr:hypothetical protein [Bacteroidota bacterium]
MSVSYHFKHQISHPSKTVSDKVNYFADYFDFVLSGYGREGFPELENHKSLLEKIKFQLDNYSKFSNRFINYYFENSYLTKNDPLIKEHYSKDWNRIACIKNKGKLQLNDVAKRKQLNSAISYLIEKLDESIFQNAMHNVITAILCEEPLHKHNHKEIFEYNTNILLSEFLFTGFPKKDLQSVFDRILSKDIEYDNDKVETDAPLPKELLNLKNDPNYTSEMFYNAVYDYLKNRTLAQQFEGFYHLFKNSSSTKTYVFKLTKIKAYKPLTFKFNSVVISNELKNKYVQPDTSDKFSTFFKEDVLMAEISLEEKSDLVGKSNALLKISEAVNFLNVQLKKEINIKTDEFLLFCNGLGIRRTSMVTSIHPEDLDGLNKSNPYNQLNSANSLVSCFLRLDAIYYQSINEERIEFKVVDFWRYLESFFDSKIYNAESMMHIASTLLSRKSIQNHSFNWFDSAQQILHSAYQRPIRSVFDNSGIVPFLNITDVELRALCSPGLLKDINFIRIKEVLNHPYLNKKIDWILNASDEEKIKSSYNFYIRILTEAYEQRNFIQHSGIYNKKSIEKVLLTLPNMIKELRGMILRELKTEKYSSFEGMFNKLLQDKPC